MKTRLSILFLLLVSLLISKPLIEVTRVTLRVLQNNLIYITVEIKSNSKEPIVELCGYVDLYDRNNNVIDKKYVRIVHAYDPMLKLGESRKRETMMPLRADMAGTARFRITHLTFLNDDKVYMLCPHCGELIIKE